MADLSESPKLLELFCVFARISAITIGGGYVMFPLMKREIVDSRHWVTDEEMVDYYALGQSVPGIIAMNTSTLVGYRKRGLPGAVAAAAGMAAPAMGIIMAVWEIGRKSVNTLSKGAIALGSFFAIVGLQLNPVLMIVAGGLLGLVLFRKETAA